MATITKLKITPVSDILGAAIDGIDLSETQSADTIADIMEVWHRHQVIVFPGQDLTEAEQIRFLGHFGEIWKMPAETHEFGLDKHRENPDITMLISNIREGGVPIGVIPDGAMGLHADNMYRQVVAKATSLFAIEVPSKGGETRFADMYKVYGALPARIRDRIEGRRAINRYTYGQFITETQQNTANAGTFNHQAVLTHPATGRKALYVSPLMTHGFEGIEQDEARALLDEIAAIIERPEHIYEHPWRVGDLVIWDNRCVLHGRTDFDPTERRLLRRVATDCDAPPAL